MARFLSSWQRKLARSPTTGKRDPSWPHWEVYGANGSPYSQKINAYMRWKRLPFLWRSMMMSPDDEGAGATERGDGKASRAGPGRWPRRFEHIRPRVIPVVVFPNSRSMNDSTFVIEAVEAHTGATRAAVPADPATAFVAWLLEDFADEFLTKVMYGFRWNREVDAVHAGRLLAYDGLGGEAADAAAGFIQQTQVGRTSVVGCPDDTIHPTCHAVCALLERHFATGTRFMLGDAPCVCDFAFFGQMSQWLVDRTPASFVPDRYTRTTAWLWRMADTGAVAPAPLRVNACARGLLRLCAATYLPFLRANAAALAAGADSLTVSLRFDDGLVEHVQQPFGYQNKCYAHLRARLAAIGENAELRSVLEVTGCWDFLAGDGGGGGRSKL